MTVCVLGRVINLRFRRFLKDFWQIFIFGSISRSLKNRMFSDCFFDKITIKEADKMVIYKTNFTPDHWFKFPNDFSERNFLWKKIGPFCFPVGLAYYGLCGGIAAAALDFFYNQLNPPTRTSPPSSKEDKPLFNWLKKRQVDTISLRNLWKYLKFMFTSKKTDQQEIVQAWDQIKQELRAGNPVLIGLERVKVDAWYKIHHLTRIVQNHQVVVWSAQQKTSEVQLNLYDPSRPQVHDARIRLNLLKNTIECYTPDLGPIYTFFKTNYRPSPHPNLLNIDPLE